MEIVRIRCKNDNNGNPRRGWIVLQDGGARFIEEGYRGKAALDSALGRKDLMPAIEINVQPGEFRDLRKMGSPNE